MLYSMTGFGKRNFDLNGRLFNIEIKTLNGKNSDINCKLSQPIKSIELQIRNLLQQILVRGNIECVIYSHDKNGGGSSLNLEIVKSYYQQLKQLGNELGIKENNIFELTMRHPDIFTTYENPELKQEKIELILEEIHKTCLSVNVFRQNEGLVLQKDIESRIQKICLLTIQIKKITPQRLEKLKENLKQKLAQINLNEEYNKDRFEQELVYYIEKFDFTEEFVRLEAHCNYFISFLKEENPQVGKGKKMGFIIQEISREINTLGSKAQDASIQKLVVEMKDELEKIKEQINNIL